MTDDFSYLEYYFGAYLGGTLMTVDRGEIYIAVIDVRLYQHASQS